MLFQVDVFTDELTQGNAAAVVHDADGLADETMAGFARWTNLAETTFLLAPTTPAADHRLRIFTSVVPYFTTGLRLAIGKGMVVVVVVVGEYIAATEGTGYRIRADAEVFNTPRYLAGVMVILSVMIMALVKALERRLAPWRARTIAGE